MARSVPLNRLLFGAFMFASAASAFTNIALGEEAASPEEKSASSLVSDKVGAVLSAVADAAKPEMPGKFISDGSKIEISKLGIKIAAPQNWEVITDHPTLSLVMQEQAPEKVVYDVPVYQRNITVAATHSPAPIDEKRAEQLKLELAETVGKQSVVSNFQVLEHKFFDYKGKNDGLVVFTSFTTGEFNMMQMHMLVSGDSNQILLSYSDLQERFSDKATYDAAWNAMASVEVTGQPAPRYQNLMVYGSVGALVLIALFAFFYQKSRRERSRYMSDADEIYNDDENDNPFSSRSNSSKSASSSDELDFPASQFGTWNLGSQHANKMLAQKSKKVGNEEGGLSFVTNF